jgi:leader peptidase (prepilin peptidase)/N-methyltransferase
VIPVVVGLFGLVVGSFLNVVIYRVPRGRSVVWPGSRCPLCGVPIEAFDNVPALFYLVLHGRCRSCKARISPRYPVVEGLTGLLFGLAACEVGLSLALVWALVLWALVLISVLVALGGIDLEHRLLPNAIVGLASVVGFALSVAGDPGG